MNNIFLKALGILILISLIGLGAQIKRPSKNISFGMVDMAILMQSASFSLAQKYRDGTPPHKVMESVVLLIHQAIQEVAMQSHMVLLKKEVVLGGDVTDMTDDVLKHLAQMTLELPIKKSEVS